MLTDVLADYRIEYLSILKLHGYDVLSQGLTVNILQTLQTQLVCMFCTFVKQTVTVLYNIYCFL
jgi:hypothetical protein